jgi:hypothetical protein
MPSVAELRDLWQRSLIVWPDARRAATASPRRSQPRISMLSRLIVVAVAPARKDNRRMQCLDDTSVTSA